MGARQGLVRPAGNVPDETCVSVHLLLIDNDAEYCERLKSSLEHRPDHAVSVDAAHNLEAALEKIGCPSPFDIVLLNLDLPDSHGLDTAIMILQAAEDIPIVVLSKPSNQKTAWETTDFGVLNVLAREQVTPDVLIRTLRHALEQHSLRSSLEKHIRELELSNGRFLSLVVDNADAIIVVDRIGIVRFVNPYAEKLLRCSASDLLGQMFGIPLEGIDTTEIDLRSSPNSPKTAEIRVMRTLWDGERAFIVTMRDITERKRNELALKLAKQSAEQANAMKSQFLANMSHELRTPLNAIIGYSEMMLAGIGGEIRPGHFKDYINDIHIGGTHLLSLINDLLDLSKAESGKLDLDEANFDLTRLGHEVIELLDVEANAKQIDLTLITNEPSTWLYADERMVKQVLLNLVSNALKFTPKEGSISVRIERNYHGETRMIVADSGIGMPKAEIPRAFAAFVQIDNAYTKSDNKGTGLGLALCKRHIELHEGNIGIESEQGHGTTVTVTFPESRAIAYDGTSGDVVSLESCAPRLIRQDNR